MNNIASLWQLIERGRKGQNIGTSTGLPKLDKIIGGIQPSRYYLIGAASSVGKTSYVLFMMYNMLKNLSEEEPVYFLYYSLEIGSEVLLAKLMALYCAEEFGVYLTLNDVLSFESPICDEYVEYLKKAKEWLDSKEKYLQVIDTTLNSKSLYKTMIPFAEKFGYYEEINGRNVYIPNNPKQRIIGIIDHFNLVQGTDGRKLKEEIDLMSSYMVTIKRKYHVTWLALQQQNRDASSMERRKADMSEPGLTDLRDTSSTSQDADCVLQLFFPFREKLSTYRGYPIMGDKAFKQTLRSCIISKNRYGIANQVIAMAFYGSVGWWKELDKAENISDPTIYLDQSKNIPCKIQKQEDLISEDFDSHKEESKTPITFKF